MHSNGRKRIGILTSGGDCPGLNAVIRGAVKSCHQLNYDCIGFLKGYEGLYDPVQYRTLTPKNTTGILNQGGTILGSTNKGRFAATVGVADRIDIDPELLAGVAGTVEELGIEGLICVGGDGSLAIAQQFHEYGIPVVGVPKTIDNDLSATAFTFGFDSAIECATDALDRLHTTAASHDGIMVLEVMGRHAGWIAAAGGLAQDEEGAAPHIILFPEIEFDQEAFLAKVKSTVETHGYCSIVASEGVHTKDGFLSASTVTDAFGHAQLGGVAPKLAQLIKSELGYKYHWALADYLQRSARHIASKTDVDLAYQAGAKAIEYAEQGLNAVMPAIQRSDEGWHFIPAPLKDIANVEQFMPRDFISEDGFAITAKAREYLLPLIQGEDFPPFKNGMPVYVNLKHNLTAKKLPEF